ncbi:2-acylglycerol O-acyltransferase 2-B-like [Lynx canadensis]|uniref:2-acylglycerol O-acyltransferase 2-B-like n=1 Tax=Lynx canadensis TaxID=61383 RepID=UPI0011AFD5B4|nr:2-acylglycerol O-acyltransferase 2-B-like [Lynx canadensis]
MFPAEASNFCTDTSGFLGLFPGLWPHLLRLSGLLSSDKASAAYLLSRPEGGQVAVLAAGGLLEALDPKASALTLRIRNQKGFVKLALRQRPVAGRDTRGLPCPGGVQRAGPERALPAVPEPSGLSARRAQEAPRPLLRVALRLFHGSLRLLPPFRTPPGTGGEPRPRPTPPPARAPAPPGARAPRAPSSGR